MTRYFLASLIVVFGAIAGGAYPLPPTAPKKDVAAIVGEFNVPPLEEKKEKPVSIDRLPYLAVALKGYEADVPLEVIRKPENAEKYALRRAVLDAFGSLRDLWGKDWLVLKRDFPSTLSLDLKQQIQDDQRIPARAIAKLEQLITQLENVGGLRDGETRRWQAHYDFALAVCRSRLAFLQEYNLMLGQLRTENLPALDVDKGENAYRLVSVDELKSQKAVKKYAEEAAEQFDKIMEERKGTPWAVAAAREKAEKLGLRWKPYVAKE